MSTNSLWRSRERSMAWYLAHPNADDEDDTPPVCEECEGTGVEYIEEEDAYIECWACGGEK